MRSAAIAALVVLAVRASALIVGAPGLRQVQQRCRAPIACAEPEPEPVAPPAAGPIVLTAEEEKALREVRIGLGNEGKYGNRDGRDPETWAVVKSDYPVLASRADEDLRNALYDLKPTTQELLMYTPIGPFIVLSTIAILLNGLAPDVLGF